MKIIILGLIIWLIYDTYKDQKNEKELRNIKQSIKARPTEKGGVQE